MLYRSVVATIAVLLVPSVAHAYLDPGTGNLLLQGMLGVLATGVILARSLWSRLFWFVTRRDSSPRASDASKGHAQREA